MLQGSPLWAEKGYPFPKEVLVRADAAAISAEDRFKPAFWKSSTRTPQQKVGPNPKGGLKPSVGGKAVYQAPSKGQ